MILEWIINYYFRRAEYFAARNTRSAFTNYIIQTFPLETRVLHRKFRVRVKKFQYNLEINHI